MAQTEGNSVPKSDGIADVVVVADRVERLLPRVRALAQQLGVEDLLLGDGVRVQPAGERRPHPQQIRRGHLRRLQLVEPREGPPEPFVVIEDELGDVVGHASRVPRCARFKRSDPAPAS